MHFSCQGSAALGRYRVDIGFYIGAAFWALLVSLCGCLETLLWASRPVLGRLEPSGSHFGRPEEHSALLLPTQKGADVSF